MKNLIILAVIASAFSCSSQSEKWVIAFKTDTEGNTISGSKKNLIDAIRAGNDIKVGWGFKGKAHSIEHVSNPIWLAVLDEQEVIAHLDPQVLSSIDWEELRPNYADSSLFTKEWRVVLSTKGDFDAVWIDRKENKVVERRPQQHPTTWFVRKADLKESIALFEE